MSSSTVSDGVVDEGAWWAAESVVECDCGGEGEEAACDAGSEAVEAAGSMLFEGEEVFAGLEDRFDPLADRRQMRPLSGFVFAAGPADGGVEVGGGVFELAAGVALVTDDGEVVGIVTAIYNPTAQRFFVGLGFAVPIENAARAAGTRPLRL